MGFFSPSSKITPKEWRLLRDRLKDQGLSERNMDDVDAIAHTSMKERGGSWGIDKNEAAQIIKYLREDRDSHSLTAIEIEKVEAAFDQML